MIGDKEHGNIRRLREELGLSQSALADELGIGRTSYVNFEKGNTKLYCKILSRLAKFSGKTELEILLGAEHGDVLMDESWKDQRKAIIDDYEGRLAELQNKLDAAEKLAQSYETTIKALSDANNYLIRQLDKKD